MPSVMRMLVVDDHGLLAEGLAVDVETRVLPAPDGASILATASEWHPHLVLLDLDLGEGVGRSTPFVGALVAGGATVVMLTGVTDPVALGECIEAGATGVLSKRLGFRELLDTLARIVAGDTHTFARQRQELLAALRAARAEQAERMAPLASLTRREREVLAGLVEGRSAQELATEMFVSVATIRSQIKAILRKLGVNSQLAAVAEARRAGLTSAA
jgi:two-component system nitrate/nitrite response regulator NarL